MAENKLDVHIVTPDREFYAAQVDFISFKTSEGDIGVMYDHVPLITTLTSGHTILKLENETYEAVLHNGFAEIGEESVSILTDAAEWVKEIDIDRAVAARQRAEARLEELTQPEEVVIQSEASLRRAIARIEAYQALQSK